MKLTRKPLSRLLALTLTGTIGLAMMPSASPLRAADHGDSPSADQDSGADIADMFLFLDPNDNTRLVMAMTVHGFIVPGEALNFAAFDPKVKFYFDIDTNLDAISDKFITVTFSEKTAAGAAQTATVDFNGTTFTAPCTAPTLAATPNPQIVTTDPVTNVKFYAGEVDDPFFFDLVAFNRAIASILAGKPDGSFFARGRDSFAGYNVLSIVMSAPVSSIKGAGNIIGLEGRTKRKMQKPLRAGGFKTIGRALTVDRMGNPAVNVALVPFARKDEYNAAKTTDDAAGKFADSIVGTLTALGTNSTNIGILAGVAVTHGDFLHLDVTIANTGSKGGDNAAAGFPNGRRPADDTIDTLLTIVSNGGLTSDGVDASDVTPQDVFPFLALPHQPIDVTDTLDDGTRN